MSKKTNSIFSKTSSSKHTAYSDDESTDEEIVFLAEYDLKNIENSSKNKKSTPSASLNQSLTYTQEQDATSDFDDDDSSIFNSGNLDTVKLDNQEKNKDDDELDDEDEDEEIKLIYDSKALLDQIDGKLRSIVVDLTTDEEVDCEVNKPKKVLKKCSSDTSPIVISGKGRKSQCTLEKYFSKSVNTYINPIDSFVFKEDRSEQETVSSDEEDLLLCAAADQAQSQYSIQKNISINENAAEATLTKSPDEQTIQKKSPEIIKESPSLTDNKTKYIIPETPTENIDKPDKFKSLSETVTSSGRKIDFASDLNMTNLYSINFNETKDKIEIKSIESSSDESLELDSPKVSASKKSEIRLKRLRELQSNSSSDEQSETIIVNKKMTSLSSSDDDMPLDLLVKKNKESFSSLKHISEKIPLKPPPTTTESKLSTTEYPTAITPSDSMLDLIPTENKALPQQEPISPEAPLQDKAQSSKELIPQKENNQQKPTVAKPKLIEQRTVSGEPLANKRSTKLIESDSSNAKRSKLHNSINQQITTTPSSSKNDDQRPSSKKKIRLTSPDRFDVNCRKKLIEDDHHASKKPVGIENLAKKSTLASNNSLNKNPMQSRDNRRLNPIDMEKKLLLKRIGTTNYINKPKHSKAFEDLKRLKSRELTGFKFKKQATYDNDMNLTQITNLAKQENLARIKAAKNVIDGTNKTSDSAGDFNALVSKSKPDYVNKEPEKQNIKNKKSPELISNVRRTSELTEPSVDIRVEKPVDASSRVPRENVKKSTITVNKENLGSKNSNNGDENQKVPATAKAKSSKADVISNIMNKMEKQQTEMVSVNDRLGKENEAKYHLNQFFFRLLKCTFNWLIEQGAQAYKYRIPFERVEKENFWYIEL